MSTSRSLSEDEINQVMDILELLAVRFEKVYDSPHWRSNLTTESKFKVDSGKGVIDVVCAVIDHYPNPEFGQIPCSFNELLLMVYHEFKEGKLMLSVSGKLLGSEEIRNFIRQARQEIREKTGLEVATYEFSKI